VEPMDLRDVLRGDGGRGHPQYSIFRFSDARYGA
jgi:hypothetical protein